MSLPLTRRIAQAALLTAVGAASAVGVAGSASAVDMPANPVGGLSNKDGAGLGDAVNKTGKTLAPAAQDTAGNTAGKAGGLLGGLPVG